MRSKAPLNGSLRESHEPLAKATRNEKQSHVLAAKKGASNSHEEQNVTRPSQEEITRSWYPNVLRFGLF